MATPISNTGSSITLNQNKPQRADEGSNKTPGQAQTQASEAVAARSGDQVSVSTAAEVLSKGTVERDKAAIQTPEQASQIAQGLKTLFAANAGQAMAAQAQNVSQDMMALLKAG